MPVTPPVGGPTCLPCWLQEETNRARTAITIALSFTVFCIVLDKQHLIAVINEIKDYVNIDINIADQELIRIHNLLEESINHA